MYIIEARGLCKRHGVTDVLKNITIGVKKGEVLAVIGPSGAGKTTLLRLLNLLEPPISGKIYFNGVDIAKDKKNKLNVRRKMAMLFQKPVVFNTTVFDNVAYGLNVRKEHKADIHKKVKGALEMVGLSGYEDRMAVTLSGGEVQRVAFARAMVIGPEALLLDEPTANLDPINIEKTEELISRIVRRYGITVVIATHDLSQGRRLSDRISVLLDGKIAQVDTPHKIFNAPTNERVARFVGVENIIEGVVKSSENGISIIRSNAHVVEAISTAHSVGNSVRICLRPEDVTLTTQKEEGNAKNSFRGTITQILLSGALVRIKVDCGFPLVSLVTKQSVEDQGLKEGDKVTALFKATAVHLM